jgi:opacity protein-like surface antigen
MDMSRLRKFVVGGLTGAILAASASTAAMAADAADQGVRVRGTVVSLSGDQLQVKSREGQALTLKLKDGWRASAVMKASIADIKPGDFVGIASLPKSGGGDGALEVLIFPPALKGTGEGSYGWDLKPNSTMTNATVGDAVKSVNGSTVTVNYHGQEKKIAIPTGTPVVTLGPATAADVKPGAVVFIPAQKDANGALSAGQVIVGKDGVVPPM